MKQEILNKIHLWLYSTPYLDQEAYMKIRRLLPMAEQNKAAKNYEVFRQLFEEEDEIKENLLLLKESIYKKKLFNLSAGFICFVIARNVIWRKGYFAMFFYHTRFFTYVLFGLSYLYITRDYYLGLKADGLLNYNEKRKMWMDARYTVEKSKLQGGYLKKNYL